MSERYRGPVIDAHHHLWDLGLGKHPWLAPKRHGDGLAPLRRNHMVEEYRDVSAGCGIAATVHVEADWDPSDPMGEVAWIEEVAPRDGIAARHVAHADLAGAGAPPLLEQLSHYERVVGIRDIVAWHPEPAKSRRATAEVLDNAAWRANLARLETHGFAFDLLITPWQAQAVRRLADDMPGIRFVVEHCASPIDRDAEGMARWRDGLRAIAAAPNTVVKLSNPTAYDHGWTFDSLADVIRFCIDCFGPERCMFGSDYPVSGLHITFGEWVCVLRAILEPYSHSEQREMLFNCARETYSVPL